MTRGPQERFNFEPGAAAAAANGSFADQLRVFSEFGQQSRVTETAFLTGGDRRVKVETFVNEFWTAKQRQAHSLHEISYRACFKPQLPRFFIERLTREGDTVYDPFMGRGTTLVEAALLGRIAVGCDVNPLSPLLVRPRLNPPTVSEVDRRLREIDFEAVEQVPEDLLVFYHPETLREIGALRKYLGGRRACGVMDAVDEWICLVAVNRLTGHSRGFFSVYTLPPNQAVSVASQRKINQRRDQVPPRRIVPQIILRKSGALLRDMVRENRVLFEKGARQVMLLTRQAEDTPEISDGSVDLVVTSPPFLDVVDYARDNWLRCWFVGVDAGSVRLTVPKKLAVWETAMTEVFRELVRVLRSGGHIAFEVGEVKGGKIQLEESVLRCGERVGLKPLAVMINDQAFTKTANCWGVDNNQKGTNTNRIVLFEKE